MKNLVIVESPGKCKTIEKYLGNGWKVVASVGHIRDLPVNDMGISLDTFKAEYVLTDSGKRVVSNIKYLAREADIVWLATDLDREGEAIAWHLKEALNLRNYKRITFCEITKESILKAIKDPTDIDMNMVNSQQGRRLLDRVVGYVVSPVLSTYLGQPSSAGRVQSVALRLVYDRDKNIEEFLETAHYGVELEIETNRVNWLVKWDSSAHCTEGTSYILDKDVATAVKNIRKLTVCEYSDCEESRNPPPPFVTSTLQQAASVNLKLSPKKTMQCAQSLYESGHITYMRTDNPNLSDDAFKMIKDYFIEQGMCDDVSDKRIEFKSPDGAQEAHV